jgi:hypothetical protein
MTLDRDSQAQYHFPAAPRPRQYVEYGITALRPPTSAKLSHMSCAAATPATKNTSLPPMNWRWVEEGDGDVGRLQPSGQPLGVALTTALAHHGVCTM